MIGEDSPQWGAVRQALFHHLDQGGAQAAVKNFDEFFDKRGTQLANEVWRPEDIDAVKKYADWKRKLIVPPDGKNWSRTATFRQMVAKYASNRIADLLGAAIGGSIGFVTHGPIGVITGQIAGASVTHSLGKMAEASLAKKLVRDYRLLVNK